MKRPPSLRRPLILYPLAVNLVILAISFAILLAVGLRVDAGGPYADERVIPIVADAIHRDHEGSLFVRQTPELADLRKAAPGLWFIAQDSLGSRVSFGPVPVPYASLDGALAQLSYGQLRDRTEPYELTAVLRRATGPAGELTILAQGRLAHLSGLFLLTSNVVLVPIFLLLALTSFVVTPWIVKRSLKGLLDVSKEAGRIDAAHRGRRLDEARVPTEIAPLVRAMNEALRRLDEGYERQRRFIAAAAHELRTPIAVLLARAETSGSRAGSDLVEDVQRLATLTGQLLDLQRLDGERPQGLIDLSGLVRRVVADLAPLLIASRRRIEVQVRDVQPVLGDAEALERVVVNLIRNAMDHGGSRITVRVNGRAFEVEDDGAGIPAETRERVLEPFQRLRPRDTGSGLGLSLVQQVVERHGGVLSIEDAPGGGVVVRVALPER